MPLTARDPSLARYRFESELDLTSHLPALHQAIDRFLSTYVDPQTGLVYHSPLGDEGSFPTRDEVLAEIPNSQGWYTAIEDCSFNGPLMLWGISRAGCGLGDDRRRTLGSLLFKGLVRLWSVPGNGFIARGICPGRDDFYPNSSPDQVPNYLRGLWAWARSGLASAGEVSQAQEIFQSVLGRLESFNWELRRSDDRVGLGGSSQMIGFSPRTLPQVLAMFAMAGDLTGQGKWIDLLRRFRDDAGRARLSAIAHDESPTWLPWQLELCMQGLQVLVELDQDVMARGAYAVGIRRMGALASTYTAGYGLWRTMSREKSAGMILAQPAAISHRLPFRPGYQKSIELGIDLTARWGQVMQAKIIEEQAHLLDLPPHDGRAHLTDHFWALSVIGHSGMPWSTDGARVQADTKENWIQVAQHLLNHCAPDIPWGAGTIAMVNFFSSWERRNEDPR